ncbi:MAG TPA: hypothetical protein PLV98_08560 [Dysgonamonadaceae bacterium]|nr:hypothetical protein [Dysgonamonadaceae bacterium]
MDKQQQNKIFPHDNHSADKKYSESYNIFRYKRVFGTIAASIYAGSLHWLYVKSCG